MAQAIADRDLELASDAMRFLADHTRWRLVQLLMQREACVSDLMMALGIDQPLTSFHLRRLRERDLVRTRRDGNRIFYSLDPEAWVHFTEPILAVTTPRALPPAAVSGAAVACGPRGG